MTQNQVHTNSLFVKWLEKPYTLNNGLYYKILISFGMGLFCFFYLTFFQPFLTLQSTNNLFLHAKVISTIVTLVLLVYYFIIRRLFPIYFKPETWTIGSHIFVVVSLMLSGCIVFWLYQKYSGYGDFVGEITLLNIIYYIFSVGFIPLAIYLFIDERLSTYKQKKQEEITIDGEFKVEEKIEEEAITIFSYNEKDSVTFTNDTLVYITSEGNYTIFFVLENDEVKEYTIRQTLSKIQKELQEHTNIIRCHKSYFVNSILVTGYRGNARGYFLSLENIEKEIPVSRNFNIKELINPV